MTLYTDKIIVVTGARRGVGRLLVQHFLQHGAQVIGLSRTLEEEPAPAGYHPMPVDVGDAHAVTQAFGTIRKTFGRVDVLVNNAAVLTSQYALIMPPAAAQAMVQTNLMGAFLVSREAAKLMRAKQWGRIIHISSMAVSLEPVGDSMYAATKAAVTTLSNIMAKEFASMNITSNSLGITAIETDMLQQLPRNKIEAVVAGLPLPRFATPDDILNVVDFFASERSSYITGQTVYLGGVH
jgi:3-oxoacyl-[acyl-carrier protein] reductase